MISDDELLKESAREAKIGDNSLAYINNIAQEHKKLSEKLASLEKEAKETKKEILEIERTKLPDAMSSVGMTTFETSEHASVAITDIVSGTPSKEKWPEVLKWLHDNGEDEIITKTIKMVFKKGEGKIADQVIKTLREKGFTVDVEESVHASTYKSWAKEKLKSDMELPLEKLCIYHGRHAQIKYPKKAK